jgi:hypothetical protein
MHSMYVFWYANVRPHWDRTRHKLEMFNEILIMFMFYLMVLFSKFNTNAETFFMFGNVYLICLAMVLAANIGLMVYTTIKKFRRKK